MAKKINKGKKLVVPGKKKELEMPPVRDEKQAVREAKILTGKPLDEKPKESEKKDSIIKQARPVKEGDVCCACCNEDWKMQRGRLAPACGCAIAQHCTKCDKCLQHCKCFKKAP